MARIQAPSDSSILKIREFLGLNENLDGDTHLRTGEFIQMVNFRVTRDRHLQLRPGQRTVLDLRTAWDALAIKPTGVTEPQFCGAWYGSVGGAAHLLAAFGGAVWDLSPTSGPSPRDLGRCTQDTTSFFGFGRKVYLLNGHDYLAWDGGASTTFQMVEGYVPTVMTACTPAGLGTLLENVNRLTGKRRVRFSPDGSSRTFTLPERAVDEIISVEGSSATYTLDGAKGTLTFASAPAAGVNTLSVIYRKGTGARGEVEGMRFSEFYNGAADTRVFLYGDGTNKTLYSGDESTDFAELGRQIHNLNVARTGMGRLIDQGGNYASGTPVQPVTANGWTGLPQTDRYQDKAALRAILERVNAGRTYDGGSAQVPTDELAMRLSAIPTGGTGGVGLSGGAGPARGSSASGWGGGYADYGTISNDLIPYLRQIYEDNLTAQLAALRAAYEQNTADYRANDDLIAQAYRDQRNQAAAQNDLQRLYLAETGVMQGLNTGAFGQLALAQSADYQGALAELLAAERQDRSANDLALRKLSVAYQGDVATAQAQSGAELAQAVYNELARQMEAEEAARRAAQAQANWEAQFVYQQQQDALDRAYQQAQWDYSVQRDQRSSAYDLAAAMLRNGILPDSATLATAGISSADAASVVRAYQQAALQSTKRSGSGGGSSGGSKSFGTGKPSMTYSQIMSAIENGQVTDAVRSGYDYFMGSGAYDQFYGGGGETSGGTTGSGGGSGMNSAYFNQMGNSISTMLAQGKGDSAVSALDGVWGQLSDDQRNQIQRLFNRYGYAYQP